VDADALRMAVLILLGGGAGAWVLSSFVWRVAGTWERVLTDEDIDDGVRRERITLAQLGPFVTGRRDVRGGYQEYSGIAYGPRVTLSRRDHGGDSLAAMGFPEGVAKKLDGEVMARLRLTLIDGVELRGTFEPQKVEFTHQPPRVTSMYFLPAKSRSYRRVQPIEEPAAALAAEPEID
jgi:hypothetical protein